MEVRWHDDKDEAGGDRRRYREWRRLKSTWTEFVSISTIRSSFLNLPNILYCSKACIVECPNCSDNKSFQTKRI